MRQPQVAGGPRPWEDPTEAPSHSGTEMTTVASTWSLFHFCPPTAARGAILKQSIPCHLTSGHSP